MSNDTDDERVQVSVWVHPDQRDDWDGYADEMGFESRGALIRNSVRYFYLAQMHGNRDRLLKKMEELNSQGDRIENKLDSVKIDQLERSDIETIANTVEHTVTSELLRIFGEVDSIEEIEPYEGSDAP